MKTIDNIVYADNGKVLRHFDKLSSQFQLGENKSLVKGEIITTLIDIKDIEELVPFDLEGKKYYIKEGSKDQMITALIRERYSLDNELALTANSRLGKTDGEEAFQSWRSVCKEAIKQYLNE